MVPWKPIILRFHRLRQVCAWRAETRIKLIEFWLFLFLVWLGHYVGIVEEFSIWWLIHCPAIRGEVQVLRRFLSLRRRRRAHDALIHLVLLSQTKWAIVGRFWAKCCDFLAQKVRLMALSPVFRQTWRLRAFGIKGGRWSSILKVLINVGFLLFHAIWLVSISVINRNFHRQVLPVIFDLCLADAMQGLFGSCLKLKEVPLSEELQLLIWVKHSWLLGFHFF